MTTTYKIQLVQAGAATGPFSLYHTEVNVTNLLAGNLTRESLVAGYYIGINSSYDLLYLEDEGECSSLYEFNLITKIITKIE